MIAVVIVSKSWGIGKNNDLLLIIPEDQRRFREITMGGVVVMGRRTFESLPGRRPLPGRLNLVLSRDPSFLPPEGTEVLPDIPSLLDRVAAYPPDRIFVIGGEEIYRLLLPYCSEAIVTKAEADPPADRFFPNLDLSPDWILKQEEPPREQNGISFRYVTYANKNQKQPRG